MQRERSHLPHVQTPKPLLEKRRDVTEFVVAEIHLWFGGVSRVRVVERVVRGKESMRRVGRVLGNGVGRE